MVKDLAVGLSGSGARDEWEIAKGCPTQHSHQTLEYKPRERFVLRCGGVTHVYSLGLCLSTPGYMLV